jgi:hypothetical protein
MQAIPCRPRRPLPSPRWHCRQAEEQPGGFASPPSRNIIREAKLSSRGRHRKSLGEPLFGSGPPVRGCPHRQEGVAGSEVTAEWRSRGALPCRSKPVAGFGMPRAAHAASVIARPGASAFPARSGDGTRADAAALALEGLRRDEKRRDAGSEPCAEGAGRAGRKGASATVRLPSTPGAVAPAAAQC